MFMSGSPSPSLAAAIASLQRLNELFQRRRRQLAQSVGLSEQQWEALEQIATEHFMPSLFARQRSSSAAAVSKILRQLLQKDLVTVRLREQDARCRRYELSQRGRLALETLRKQRSRAIQEVWESFDPVEIESFARFGARLADRLERYSESYEKGKK